MTEKAAMTLWKNLQIHTMREYVHIIKPQLQDQITFRLFNLS